MIISCTNGAQNNQLAAVIREINSLLFESENSKQALALLLGNPQEILDHLISLLMGQLQPGVGGILFLPGDEENHVALRLQVNC